MPTLALKFGISFEDLYSSLGVAKIDDAFLKWLDEASLERVQKHRGSPLMGAPLSEFLTDMAPCVARFIETLFDVVRVGENLDEIETLAAFRRLFIQKRVIPQMKAGTLEARFDKTLAALSDLDLALQVNSSKDEDFLVRAAAFCAWKREQNQAGKLFEGSHPIDYTRLVETHGRQALQSTRMTPRVGFDLTHQGMSRQEAVLEARACLHCHVREKDSCAKGFENGQVNPLGTPLEGCPLGQKISEMAFLRARGEVLAALVTACLDNPLMILTGDRICHDCRTSCIFQKQTPIDVPALETSILMQILESSWGFEIYSLLTRWSPLASWGNTPCASSGKTVLVAGMGPSGITTAHHLLNAGHHVVGIEGLKITPLDGKLLDAPIHNVTDLYIPLSEREPDGVGGVAEYGITVRWDKNRLKLLRLLMERRESFSLLSGVRYLSQINEAQAFEMGFDHIALCLGAGAPQLPNLESLPPGVRAASDFLMNLHMGAAYKKDTLASMTVTLPAYVIGGGLTAIDAATELQAYYIVQVERFASRYQDLVEVQGEEAACALFQAQDRSLMETFLAHACEVSQERRCADEEGRAPNFHSLVTKWGGVHVLYRRALQDAPAYRTNAREVQHALDEGIVFHPHTILEGFDIDSAGRLTGLRVNTNGKSRTHLTNTVLLATGTLPNAQVPTSKDVRVTHHGDMDPSYQGSVVKAMASATKGARRINARLAKIAPSNRGDVIAAQMRAQTQAKVLSVKALCENVWEIRLYAPMATRAFRPGQFFRLQNYHPPFMEPLALTGAGVDKEKGELFLIVLSSGASSWLTQFFKKGDDVCLMGPTGAPTLLPENKNVLLVGGGLGNAVLFSIGQALLARGCLVTYIAGYKTKASLFKQEAVKASASQVIWCVEKGDLIESSRPQDLTFQGTVLAGLDALESAPDHMIVIGSSAMMQAVESRVRSSFFAKTQKLASVCAPMQCMMKGVCGACVQLGRDASGKNAYIFLSCVDQDHFLHHVDMDALAARLSQNQVEEALNWAWIRLRPIEETLNVI